jgi:hypothetical protein
MSSVAANVAHKAVVGTLFFFTCWGTYSVAGGTGIILQRRWDRKKAAEAAGKPVYSVKDELLAPVRPDGTLDMESIQHESNKVRRV